MQVNAATLYPTNTKEPTIYPSSPPSRGPSSVPVDTTGDGIADHIGYDTNSDGQLDTFTPIMQHTQPMMQQPYSGHHQPITQQPYSGHHQQQGVQMQMQQQQQGTGTLHIKYLEASGCAECRQICICTIPWDPIQPSHNSRYELCIDGESKSNLCVQGFSCSYELSPYVQHTVELKSTGVSGFFSSVIGAGPVVSVKVQINPGQTKTFEIGHHFQRCVNKRNTHPYFQEKMM